MRSGAIKSEALQGIAPLVPVFILSLKGVLFISEFSFIPDTFCIIVFNKCTSNNKNK